MVDDLNQRSPGARFRTAVEEEKPLQVAGAINAYAARLAESSWVPSHLSLRWRSSGKFPRAP